MCLCGRDGLAQKSSSSVDDLVFAGDGMRKDAKKMNRIANLASGKRGTIMAGAAGKRGTLMSGADGPVRAAKRASIMPTTGEKGGRKGSLAFDEGQKWKRAPGSISGKWIDEDNKVKVIELMHGSEGPLKVRDEACRELGTGDAWRGEDGRDHAHIVMTEGQDSRLGAFAPTKEGDVAVSGDGQQLLWDDGTVWRRSDEDEGMLGTWVDDSGERKVVKVNVNPDAVEDLRSEHASDLKNVLDKYRQAKQLADHALHQLFELRPWLGVQVADEETGEPSIGVQVTEVSTGANGEESVAGEAGISEGEYITAVQGVPITSKKELEEQLARLTAGDTVSIEVSASKTAKRQMVEVVLGADGVRMEDVQALRAACDVEAEVFERPGRWKRFGESFLHPSQQNEFELLNKRIEELQKELEETRNSKFGANEEISRLNDELVEALRMAEHPVHQLFELQPWMGVEVEDEPTDGKGLRVKKLRMQDADNDGDHDSGAGAAGIEDRKSTR